MELLSLNTIFSDSSARAKFFSQYFAIFAVIYHVAFIIAFHIYGVKPMVYMNFYSVPYFITLAIITPRLKSYVATYLISCLEVYTHQTLGVFTMGAESAFHYFFIPFALLPLYTFKSKYSFAMVLSSLGGIVFFLINLFSSRILPVYEVPRNVLEITRGINIFLAVAVILSSVFIYSYIAWISEIKLRSKIVRKEHQLDSLQGHIVNSLADLVENRDSETGEHIQRTSFLVEMIARGAYEKEVYPEVITENFIQLLKRAAPMHDIGKIVVSDIILKKPGRLTELEYEDIKRHTTEGFKIVKDIIGVSNDENFIRITQEVALSHHERWDGLGYPHKIKEDVIPVSARIMSIADVYDALVSKRCYKESFSREKAIAIMKAGRGTQFDPVLLDVFIDKIGQEDVF